MENVLKNADLREDEKMQRYGQLFLRYQTMQRKMEEKSQPSLQPQPSVAHAEPEALAAQTPILEAVPKTYRNKAKL